MGFFIGAGTVLVKGGKYVLIREVRHEKAGFWNLPAGTLQIDEDFIQCVQREAAEETGVEVNLEHFLGVYQAVIGTGSNVVFVVFAGSVSDDARLQSDEHDEIGVFAYDEIVALDKAGKLRSPSVLKAIQNHRHGKLLPLSSVQSWHVDSLASITVEKDH